MRAMLILAALAFAQTAPQLGPMNLYGDWAVACDNVRRCEMTSLQSASAEGADDRWQLSLTRAAGPTGGWVVELFGEDAPVGVTLQVEGAAAVWRGERLVGAAAQSLVDAMVNGKALLVRDRSGKAVARVSLAGSSASLRFIDAQQGRAGTVTAAVAKGPRGAATVPAAAPLPVITAVRAAGTPATVSRALRDQLGSRYECASNYDPGSLPDLERFALGGGATLVLIPCGAGAYNFSSVPYIVRAGKAQLARFDAATGFGENEGPPMLVNAGFDAKTGELTSYAKGRGLGDCGTAQSFVWDGTRFRLTEQRVMDDCRGSTNWLAVWRARAVAK
ncbi:MULTISPECIES: DUF1176 domain-containing protein [unclassified Sphingomonas]|uniref:DUF1176 domain-containing protein n=1 Tax=unclassified Sphingomonas TaxID=196159 RepID=UPI0008319F03|nr:MULTISPECIES: DUF1176 domain-containing protein [unclassified Sphingomonas]